MDAVVRVKRNLDEDPLDTFILKCKKRKINSTEDECDSQEGVQTTILKFAKRIRTDENILDHLKSKQEANKDLKANFKKHEVNLTHKLRLEHQEASKNSRFKIVNLLRGPNLDVSEESSDLKSKQKITIVDVETDINENNTQAVNQNNDSSNKFVYDLYYTSSHLFEEVELEEYVSIYPLNDPLVVGTSGGLNESDSSDSEDSNAESNWKNEYPDEDDMESINEDDMIEAMKNVELDDLSNDSGEENYVYDDDSDSEYHDATDEGDVEKYGRRYAEFKAKHKSFVETTSFDQGDLYYGDIDENEYYY